MLRLIRHTAVFLWLLLSCAGTGVNADGPPAGNATAASSALAVLEPATGLIHCDPDAAASRRLVSVEFNRQHRYVHMRVNTGSNDNLQFEIFNSDGRLVFKNVSTGRQLYLNSEILEAGEHTWKVSSDGKTLGCGKLAVE